MLILEIVLVLCVIILLYGFFKVGNNKEEKWKILTPAVTLIAVIVTIHFSSRNLELSKRQVSLQLRPFISVIKPSFEIIPGENESRYWLVVNYFLENFGAQPAHEYKRKNDKIIEISLSPELLNKREQMRLDPNATLTEKDKAFENIINERKRVMNILCRYLRKHPMASYEDINIKFGNQNVHCYGDISEHFQLPTVISPKQILPCRSGRDIGLEYGQGFASGNKVLIYYVYLTYEGAIKQKEYSTFYIGYYDENLLRIYKGNATLKISQSIPFSEYQQWMEREKL